MFQSTNQWLLAKPPLRLSRLMLIYSHVPLTMFETTNQIHHFSPHFWSPQKKIHGKSQIHHDPPAWRSAAADVDLRYGQRPRSWDFTMENLGEIEGNMMKHRLFSFRMGWSMIKRLFSSMKFWTLKNWFFHPWRMKKMENPIKHQAFFIQNGMIHDTPWEHMRTNDNPWISGYPLLWSKSMNYLRIETYEYPESSPIQGSVCLDVDPGIVT